MSEKTTKEQQFTSKVEKLIEAVGAHVDAAVGELNGLQSKGLEQARTVVASASRAAQEQLAFAEQMGNEWRKLMLGATRAATELFTPKA